MTAHSKTLSLVEITQTQSPCRVLSYRRLTLEHLQSGVQGSQNDELWYVVKESQGSSSRGHYRHQWPGSGCTTKGVLRYAGQCSLAPDMTCESNQRKGKMRLGMPISGERALLGKGRETPRDVLRESPNLWVWEDSLIGRSLLRCWRRDGGGYLRPPLYHAPRSCFRQRR